MPLAGTVCCQDGLPQSFDTCLDRCRNRGCVYPLPLLVAMAGNADKRQNVALSATMLAQCPRQTVLKAERDYHEAPAEYHARWRGEAVHSMAERGGPFPGVVQEKRIRKLWIDPDSSDNTALISGQPDWWDETHQHLADWKSTKVCPSEPYSDHEQQVNIYAWLLDGGEWEDGTINTIVPLTAEIIYIDPTRSKTIAVDLWTPEAFNRMMRRRTEPLIEHLRTGILPEGLDMDGPEAWKAKFCPFAGSGECCADKEIPHGS